MFQRFKLILIASLATILVAGCSGQNGSAKAPQPTPDDRASFLKNMGISSDGKVPPAPKGSN